MDGIEPLGLTGLSGNDDGKPQSSVNQIDYACFIQDERRRRRAFTVTVGMRYEGRTNIASQLNFAPRIFFTRTPDTGDKRPLKIVIRAGFGVFYDGFDEFTILESRHCGSSGLPDFIVTDAAIQNFVLGRRVWRRWKCGGRQPPRPTPGSFQFLNRACGNYFLSRSKAVRAFVRTCSLSSFRALVRG